METYLFYTNMKRRVKALIVVLAICLITVFIRCQSNETPIQQLVVALNGDSIEMVFVKGGTFMMGCTDEQGCDCEDNEKPVRKESVSDFYIGKYEVTQRLWRAVMDTDSILPFNGGCEDCPMENVSWKNAQEFIGRLNAMTGKTFRLPTEAEWEYAARGGHKSKHYKYSGSNQVSEVAWYVGNSSGGQYGEAGTTRPVGLKKSNELGLYDMSGNVWEWCGDLYTKEYKQGGKSVHPGWPFEGTYLFFRRILRGGSWGGTAKGCRVSYIDYDIANYSDEYGGFRLVMELNFSK